MRNDHDTTTSFCCLTWWTRPVQTNNYRYSVVKHKFLKMLLLTFFFPLYYVIWRPWRSVAQQRERRHNYDVLLESWLFIFVRDKPSSRIRMFFIGLTDFKTFGGSTSSLVGSRLSCLSDFCGTMFKCITFVCWKSCQTIKAISDQSDQINVYCSCM